MRIDGGSHMESNASATTESSPDLNKAIVRRMVQILITILIQAAVLFLSSGRPTWWEAWAYIAVYLVGITINAIFLLRRSPETIAERGQIRENWKVWDKVIGGLFGVLYFFGILLTAGFDERWGWTGAMPLGSQIAGFVVFGMGSALFSWAMITNAYFSTAVRIQYERGHAVCSSGPYRYLRHPGYLGATLQSLAMPFMFGSLWTLIPAVLAAILLVIRTALEDRTLQGELDGYQDYAQEVRFRLLPGLW
jgi:protein-S-isoprenylcysteine O-methyltransferase Ste14